LTRARSPLPIRDELGHRARGSISVVVVVIRCDGGPKGPMSTVTLIAEKPRGLDHRRSFRSRQGDAGRSEMVAGCRRAIAVVSPRV
jgi:hypothetical protein